MNMHTTPPMDPIRALHIAAMAALIERTLRPDHSTPQSARAQLLLNKLTSSGMGSLSDAGGVFMLNIHGIDAVKCEPITATALLRDWQSNALLTLAKTRGARA